jgi:hypothetical protein
MITPELANVILDAIDSALIDVHTALPGAVQTYDATTQTAEIEIQTKRILERSDGSYLSEELPILVNVPVAVWGSVDYLLGFALSPGDTGMLVFSETSLDQWRTKGEVTSPSDIERHGLSGAVFWPGGVRDVSQILADVLTSGAVFGKRGGAQLRANGTTMEATSSGAAASTGGFVALATLCDTLWSTLDTVLRNWTPVANDGGAALKTAYLAAFPTPPSSVASSNLKAD